MLKVGPWKEFKKGICIYYELHPVVNLREVITRKKGGRFSD
jgi:hypothetical protein